MDRRPRMIILCADDYALTDGVSRAIGELAAARRLSATSVIVTSPHWKAAAPRLRVHRGRMSIGLHLDLTLGPAAGPIRRLAPKQRFPGLAQLIGLSLLRVLDTGEIAAEISRQLDLFETELGYPPDHVDGHQHVHALPVVRQALIEVVARRYPVTPPMLRDPADTKDNIRARALSVRKALVVNALSKGFGEAAKARGLSVNQGFSGFSDFDLGKPYGDELRRAFVATRSPHIVMCHPGHVDAELARRDPVVERRQMEYDALMREPDLPQRIWRPARASDGPPIAWQELAKAEAALA
jgi:chitin disaccharide deacetylase